jgi:Tfp pilus assembly protein PilZ
MFDMRRHKRKAVSVEIRCRDETGSGQLVFDLVDLSAGGAFLKSDVLFEQGEKLHLELDLATRLIRSEANVVWVRRFPDPHQSAGMGVAFALPEEDRQAIEEYLEK